MSGQRYPFDNKPFDHHQNHGSNPRHYKPARGNQVDKNGFGEFMPPHPDNVKRRQGDNTSPNNVEWMGKKPARSRDDKKMGRDPNEWSPAPQKSRKHKKTTGGGGGGGNAANKKRDYEKPW